MNAKGPKNLGVFLILGASVCFACMNALTRYADRLPAVEIAFFRAFINLIFLVPYMVRKKISFLGRHRALLTIRGIAGFSSLVLGFYAISLIDLSDVTILWKTSAIFTAVLSAIFLKERISPLLSACIAGAFVGATLIVKPKFDVLNVPGIAALAAGFAISIVGLSIRKLHDTEESLTIIFSFCLWGTILGFLLSLNNFIIPNFREAWVLLWVGTLGAVGQLLYTDAFRHASAAQIQPYQYFEVLVAMTLGVSIWGELPDMWDILGTVLIVICGIYVYRSATPAYAIKQK